MCPVLLLPGGYPIAVTNISYTISYSFKKMVDDDSISALTAETNKVNNQDGWLRVSGTHFSISTHSEICLDCILWKYSHTTRVLGDSKVILVFNPHTAWWPKWWRLVLPHVTPYEPSTGHHFKFVALPSYPQDFSNNHNIQHRDSFTHYIPWYFFGLTGFQILP
jgi:hypothetical protein